MAGTHTGGKQAGKTNKERHGDDFYFKLGKKGGAAKVPKGFAVRRDLASKAGAVGGRKSRRGKKL